MSSLIRRDNWQNDRQFDEIQQLAFEIEQLRSLITPQYGDWTMVIEGSGNAGTYEIATQKCRYVKIGKFVFLTVYAIMDAILTAGGTGILYIKGLPFVRRDETYPQGTILLSGIDWTAGANLTLSFVDSTIEDDRLLIQQTIDNAANTQIPITAIAANDTVIGSICYETVDE